MGPDGKFSDLPAYGAQPVGCRWSPPDPFTSTPEMDNFNNCSSRNRLDKITQARVRVRKNIGKHWTLETYYRYVDWSSNTAEYDFDRHIVGLAATFRR